MVNLNRLKQVVKRGLRFVKTQGSRLYDPQRQVPDTVQNEVSNSVPVTVDDNAAVESVAHAEAPTIPSPAATSEEPITETEEVRNKRTADHWSENTLNNDFFSANNYWLAVPEVNKRYNQKATLGQNPNWAVYFLNKYVPNKKEAVMASIGCGAGQLECLLAQNNGFAQCDAFDIAPGAIEIAKKAAHDKGFHHINYEVSDVNGMSLKENHYDVIWFNNSLHHISQLEFLYEQIVHALKPNGYLIFNEYIGPSRFDFTPRQKEVMKAAFALIPMRFKRSFVPGHNEPYLLSTAIPDPAEVERVDPSESVRSEEIMMLLEDYFDIVEYNVTGGTILQFLLLGIAGNFRTDDPESIRVLDMLFAIEDTLIDIGDIQSDFACVAATPKKK